MLVKDIFWKGIKYELRDGKNISFWEDKWIDATCLSYKYKELFEASGKQKIIVNQAYGRERFRLHLHGRLDPIIGRKQEELLNKIQN